MQSPLTPCFIQTFVGCPSFLPRTIRCTLPSILYRYGSPEGIKSDSGTSKFIMKGMAVDELQLYGISCLFVCFIPFPNQNPTIFIF